MRVTMSGKPIVSVIITTFKRPDRVEIAIKSVLNQTYSQIELIIIDDNITNTEAHIRTREIVKRYPQVRYFKNKNNLGGALSRNEGIKKANGEYLAFLDDDDAFHPTKLEKQIRLLHRHEADNVGIVYCYSARMRYDGKILGYIKEDAVGSPVYNHMLNCIASTSLWLAPKKILIDCGGFTDSPSKQDSIMILKVLAKGYTVYRVPEILVDYYEHGDNGISGMKPSNIIGILSYRAWCRDHYYLLDKKKQVNDVELNFSKQLISVYIMNNRAKKALDEFYSMACVRFFSISVLKSFIKLVFAGPYKLFIKARSTR